MTNSEIIERNKQSLAAQGILSYTGRVLEGTSVDGTPVSIPEVEAIHTFNGWKQLGFKVKKGEHAVARFTIWKYSSKWALEVETEEGEKRAVAAGKMFLKESCWFTFKQVEPMEVPA